jgi:hypothetical protein
MQIKGWRLVAASPFVNAAAGAILLFGAAACSRGEKGPEAPSQAAPIAAGLELPAVWSTRPLSGPVRDVAMSTGGGAILAVAYERGGLEFFDMEGERIGEPALFRLKAIADGRSTSIGDAAVTLFPGITEAGELKGYVYSPGLMAPTQIDLPITEERAIQGLCTGDSSAGGLIRIAYWTLANSMSLTTGVLSEKDGDLSWTPEAATQTDFPVTSCVFAQGTLVASPRSGDSASLTRGDYSALLSLEDGRPIQISTDYGLTTTDVGVRDGITIEAPRNPTAITALGTLPAGGFPGGVVVVAGETATGEHQVVFIDPSEITLEPLADE